MAQMTQDRAQILALQALGWLAGQPERMERFLDLAGTDIDGLRASAAQPETLVAIMDYLLSEDAMVIAFCAEAGISPETAAAIRAALPGGAETHWT